MATPYPPKGVHWHNIGQLKPFLVALSNAAGAGMASIPPVLGSNHQPLSLLNGKVLIDGSVCLSGDHPQGEFQ